MKEFEDLVETMARLRDPDGCPWDREQTAETLKTYLLEEVYEVLEALSTQEPKRVCEELGDLLLQIIFLSRIFEEQGHFNITSVITTLKEKLIHRHPHVFGNSTAETSGEVRTLWEKIKMKEKGKDSLLQGLPSHMPSLLKAFRLGEKASTVGFDWDAPDKVLDKVEEEIGELRESLQNQNHEGTVEETGDLLFSLANFARKLKLNPEIALQEANKKFEKRFHYVEQSLHRSGKKPEQASPEEMNALWEESKKVNL